MPNHRPAYRNWAIIQDDPDNPASEWTAKCWCGWQMTRPTYISARTATMHHYYVCPKRWEAFPDDDPV